MNNAEAVRKALLDWYDRNRRVLPWRAPAGLGADPYAVWLSEIMLQQTTVAAVRRYFRDFMRRWPTVDALAAAPDEEVMKAWAGLGYYARARNLLACARVVVAGHGGRFPESEEALRGLPGVGAYTAAAIAAIAFDRPATVVDGNVERVVARFFASEEPLPGAKPRLRALAARFTPGERPGDLAQAMMDLGAMVCTPRRPACPRCPLEVGCVARARGIAEALPNRAPKAERPHRHGVAFWVARADGHVLLRKRPPKGLLGGMTEFPSTAWEATEPDEDAALRAAPVHGAWEKAGRIEHTFTHFHLTLALWRTEVGSHMALRAAAEPERCFWVGREQLAGEALPSVMRKLAALAIEGGPDHARRRA